MAKCSYKTRGLDEKWECPLDALLGEEYCYWHKEEDGKGPTEEQLKELNGRAIWGVYLQKAKLCGANLQGARLFGANLQKAELYRTNLQGARLSGANLQKAELLETNLQGARLSGANLQKAWLYFANLQEAWLDRVNLQKAELHGTNLQGARLSEAELQGTKLSEVELQGADLYSARFDPKTDLFDSILVGANLYRSYFDETKSFRNATVFQNSDGKEINEIVGDALGSWFIHIHGDNNKYPTKIISRIAYFVLTKILNEKSNVPLHPKPSVIDMETVEIKAPDVAAKLRGEGLIRYAGDENGISLDRIIFFDWSSGCAIKNPENPRRHERSLVRVEELADLILKDGRIQSDFLYKGSRASLYEASYEVYNNLYNFYTANGRLDQAAHVHYRRGEAHRKLLKEKGVLDWWRSLIFDFFVLNLMTGYGDKIRRPVRASIIFIVGFAALFQLSEGIVKNVNGELVEPDGWDYLYHSITTFTSLGYSNIQPNLAAGHLPQLLVAVESGLGVLMMALIIFVVTFKVSR